MTPEEEYLHITRLDPPVPVKYLDYTESFLAVNFDWPYVRVKCCSDGSYFWTSQTNLEL